MITHIDARGQGLRGARRPARGRCEEALGSSFPSISPASIGQVQAAKARVEQARLAEERLAHQVTGDVITAREAALTAGEEVEAALGDLRAAEAAAELSQVRFEGGVGIGLEVLDAQAALSEARSNVIAAIVAYDAAQVALLRALGGVSIPALLEDGEAGQRPSP